MRKAVIERKTAETEISVAIDLDGKGEGRIDTSIPFFDHMLNLFSRHGLIDLDIRGRGDTAVDDHHLVEDMGICLGQAVRKALGERKGISRYGSAVVPMDESLCDVAMDLSGRPYLAYQVDLPKKYKLKDFDPGLAEDFFQSVVNHAGMNLHIRLHYGRDVHHMLEGIFKAFGRALDQATSIDPRIKGVLSTKGKI